MDMVAQGPLGDLRVRVGASGRIGASTLDIASSFVRPADVLAYASGDLVANSVTAGSVIPLTWAAARDAAGGFAILRARFRKTGTATAGHIYRIHLFELSPTVTNGDNGVFLPNQADSWLGSLDVASMQAFSDGAVGTALPTSGTALYVALASGQSIYGLVEARGAATPASAETIAVTLEVSQD